MGFEKIWFGIEDCSSHDFHEEGFDGLQKQHLMRKKWFEKEMRNWIEEVSNLAHVVLFLASIPRARCLLAHNKERADAWLDHVRDNDQKLAQEILT
ncbi:hypothetical protein Tco_0804803 [Tanacetum coccineum]|uniref:Uncharacterized protein n=1 Tax=Tanacetum coccineum TaxID=301880 RepID=A0ABQ5A668_9ASTR